MNTAELLRIDLPDGHLAYRAAGSGPPVVLLHGGGLDHRMWTEQLDALAAGFRVVAVDARGHGRSATPTGAFRHCDDLAVLLERLDIAPAALVGVSLGASTALDVALEHPHLARAVVVVGAGTGEPEFRDPFVLGVFADQLRAAQQQDRAGWIEASLRLGFGPDRALDEVDPVVVGRCREMLRDTLARHVGPAGPVLPTPVTRSWERLPGIGVPVLAVVGDLDSGDHNGMAARVARSVPDGRLATVTGAAHYPNMERPAEFDRILLEFLRERAG
jgi:pimeloyl-ACP methyl ester carboxylesterase